MVNPRAGPSWWLQQRLLEDFNVIFGITFPIVSGHRGDVSLPCPWGLLNSKLNQPGKLAPDFGSGSCRVSRAAGHPPPCPQCHVQVTTGAWEPLKCSTHTDPVRKLMMQQNNLSQLWEINSWFGWPEWRAEGFFLEEQDKNILSCLKPVLPWFAV